MSPDSNQSFSVHLQSLTDFARELETQIEGLTKPADGLYALNSAPMLLGEFNEAYTLRGGHQVTVSQVSDLLGQVKQAIGFAQEVTTTVAAGYQHTDAAIAGALDVSALTTAAATAGSTLTTITTTVDTSIAGTVEAAIESVTGTAPTATPATIPTAPPATPALGG